MSATSAEALNLTALAFCGLKVDEDGHLNNWQDLPARRAKPLYDSREGSSKRGHRTFTAEEDDCIKRWMTAAGQSRQTGTKVYEELETILPSHSWQAHQNRWRRVLKHSAQPTLVVDRPFPNLDKPAAQRWPSREASQDIQESTLADVSTTEDDNEAQITYSDSRLDIDRSLLHNLGLDDESDLELLLQQRWVQETLWELQNGLQKTQLIARNDSNRFSINRSHHVWKLDRAQFVLESSDLSSRYKDDQPDMTTWTEDDFDIRFITRLAQHGCQSGRRWEIEERENGWRPLCEKALWLLLWYKWLHKPTAGTGREMQRQQRKKDNWLATLANIRESFEATNAKDIVAASTSAKRRYARQNSVNRQLFFISDEARRLYLHCRNRRLASWGVSMPHAGTCIQVPSEWSSTQPEQLLDKVDAWPKSETEVSRLALPLASFRPLWARAAGWFEVWPRDMSDLQHFLPPHQERPTDSHMHGSHLCHHGLCIVPNHIVYESRARNISRRHCANSALVLRAYKVNVPQHCVMHEPPCLLQHAALTTFEAFSIQFAVLRIAKDLPARAPMARPTHHPQHFDTFEQEAIHDSGLFPFVGISPENVVRIRSAINEPEDRGFSWSCPFCSFSRGFAHITRFWSHLRVDHTSEPQETVLAEVKRSAGANIAWIEEKFYDYERNNPATWQKLIQSQAVDFSWEVFTGWRLPQTRLYEGRSRYSLYQPPSGVLP